MLSLMIPGVGMGGLESGGIPPGSGLRFLTMLGVGRSAAPWIIGIEGIRRVIIEFTHLQLWG